MGFLVVGGDQFDSSASLCRLFLGDRIHILFKEV